MRRLVLAFAALASSAAFADTSLVVVTEGRLLDAQDKPVSGPTDLTVRFYSKSVDASGENNLVWQQKYTNVAVENGVYTLAVGDPAIGKALDLRDWTGEQRWMAIVVGTDSELAPRLRVGTMPLALHAADATTVGGHAPGDFAAASHTHTAAEVTDFAAAVGTAASGKFALAAHQHVAADTTDFVSAAVAAALASGKFAAAGSAPSYSAGAGIGINGGVISADPTALALLDGAQTLTGFKTFAPSTGSAPFAVASGKTGLVANLNADFASGVRLDVVKTFACPSGQFVTGFGVATSTGELTPTCGAPAIQPTTFASCKAVPAGSPSGVYTLTSGGGTMPAYCDMTTDNGGWTLCAALGNQKRHNGFDYASTVWNTAGTAFLTAGGQVVSYGNFCTQLTFTELYGQAMDDATTVYFKTGKVATGGVNPFSAAGATLLTGTGAYIGVTNRTSFAANGPYYGNASCGPVTNGGGQGTDLCIGTGTLYQQMMGNVNSDTSAQDWMCDKSAACGNDTDNVVLFFAR